MVVRLCLILLSFFVAQPTLAQTSLPDVSLTSVRVEAVITAYPLMRERLETLDAEFDDVDDADSVASSLQALAIFGSANSALNSAAQDNGFADFMDWLSATNAVVMAHAFGQNGGMDAQMQEALEGIDNQSGLSDAQKEQMKAMILQSMGVIETMRPPEENIAAVEPYHDAIEAMLEE